MIPKTIVYIFGVKYECNSLIDYKTKWAYRQIF